MRPSLKHISFALLAVVLSLAATALCAEVALRLFFPQQEAMRWHLSSARYGYLMKKSYAQDYKFVSTGFVMKVQTNSYGLRDIEQDLSVKHRPRIVLLGDSFTFGHGVNYEDAIAARLREHLKLEGLGYDVVSAAVVGWGTEQEARYFKDNAALLAPDVLVVTFCGNDPMDDTRFLHDMKDSERGIFYFPGKVFLREHFQLYQFLHAKVARVLYSIVLKHRMSKEGLQQRDVDAQSAGVITEQDWQETLARYREIHAALKAQNPSAVMIVQASNPVNQDHRKHLMTLASEGGIIYNDMADEVGAVPEQKRVMPHDEHWSPLLHDMYAKALADVVKGLSPAPGTH